MTNAELNRDIKRLYKDYSIYLNGDSDVFFSWVGGYAKKEFFRLYHADLELSAMNKNSILMLLKINRHLRLIPFHQFYINAKF